MEMPRVEQVRSFNRTMTERIGVLHDHFLGRNHPLGEARLLWEIGAQGASVRSLRRRLGLDSAYISRLLRSLEGQGLIVVGTSENDGRVRQVQLTEAGLRERAELDQRADAFARSLLEPLSESQRVKLVAAMAEVERILIASMVKIAVADPTSPDARWCFEQYSPNWASASTLVLIQLSAFRRMRTNSRPPLACCSSHICERSRSAVAQ